MMKRETVVHVAILLLAFGLRMIALDARPVWYDESFAILYASRSFVEMIAGTVTQVAGAAADVHPLLYYFSLHVWMQIVGDSALTARFWSILFGMATIPLVYQIARAWFGARVGWLAMLIVAVAPFHIAYSQEARMYAPLAFWSALALYAFTRFRQSTHKWWWSVFVLAGALALYSHNLAFLNFAALGFWVILDAIRRRSAHLLRATVFAGIAMFVLWLPWLIFVPGQFGKIAQAYWVPPPSLLTLVQTAMVFAFDFDNAAMPAILAPFILFGAILAPLLIAFELMRARRSAQRVELSFALGMAILPIGMLLLVSQWRPVYITRALLPAFLWYAILFAWALTRMPQWIRVAVVVGMSLIVIVVLPAYYTYTRFPRARFDAVAQALRAQMRPGDAIVHDNKLSFFPMYYYDRALAQSFIADPPGAASDTLAYPTQQALQIFAIQLDVATANQSRVWLIIFQNAIIEAAETGQTPSNVLWMEQHFHRVSIESFDDLRIYLYETR